MTTAAVTDDLIVTRTRALKLPGVARVFESLARGRHTTRNGCTRRGSQDGEAQQFGR